MEAPPICLPDWVDEDAEDGGFDAQAMEDAARGGPLTDEELAGFFDGALDFLDAGFRGLCLSKGPSAYFQAKFWRYTLIFRRDR